MPVNAIYGLRLIGRIPHAEAVVWHLAHRLARRRRWARAMRMPKGLARRKAASDYWAKSTSRSESAARSLLALRDGVEEREMKRSTDRILTTHAGSLPRPPDLTRMMWDLLDEKPVDQDKLATPGAGGRRRGGRQAARGRHRHRLRRRDEQGRLQQLRDAALLRLRQSRAIRRDRPRRLSGHHQQAVRRERRRPPSRHAQCRRTDRAARQGRRAARHRQLQGGARRRIAGHAPSSPR